VFVSLSLGHALSLSVALKVLENERWVDFLFLTDCYTPSLHLSLLTSCLCAGQSETNCSTHTFLIISSCLVSVCAAWHCSCPSVFVFPCVTLWITLTSCWDQESNSKRLSMSQKTQISPNNSCSDWYLVSAREPDCLVLFDLSTWQIGFLSAALMHSVYISGPSWSGPYSLQYRIIISWFKCFSKKPFHFRSCVVLCLSGGSCSFHRLLLNVEVSK